MHHYSKVSRRNTNKDKEAISLKQNDVISAANFSRSRSTGMLDSPGATLTPGDRVIFAESPGAPGIPIIYRTAEERAANPDRLNLDRRRLTVCPILEGEEQLRLLNYQHNSITRIHHLNGLRRLIFLDLYDNHIEEISGLSALKSLRVLMLGKNRITHIENLNNLTKLDVLDLHGNQIRKISNLNHLTELRVLNLAGNQIEHVSHLLGMDALTELNLRRNQIHTVTDLEDLKCLQRLFLSFNEITSFEDISCLADCSSLTELSLDGNPICQDPSYKKNVIRHLQKIKQLDMKRVTDEERRQAHAIAKKEEEKKRESNKLQMMKERRQMAINNAKRQWEVMQGSLMTKTNKVVRNMPDLYANHISNVPTSEVLGEEEDTASSRSSSHVSRPPSAKSISRPQSAKSGLIDLDSRQSSQAPSRASSARSREPPEKPGTGVVSLSGPSLDHLTELEGDTLRLYGTGSVDAFDKNWGIQAAGAVTTIVFKFIDFDEIIKHLHKIRVRFPNVHTLELTSTNIVTLQQLNALSAVRRLDHLTIDLEGNPVTKFTMWKTYILFRLAHFNLKTINGGDITASEILSAEKFFGTMSHMTSTQLPQARLLSLLGESKRKQLLSDDKKKPLSSEGRLTDRGSESVGRAGLSYTPPDLIPKDSKTRKLFVDSFVRSLACEAMDIGRKQAALQRVWPQVFYEMIQSAVIDMWDSQTYRKKCLEELDKR